MDSKELFIKRVLALLLIVGIGLIFRFIFSKVDMDNGQNKLDKVGDVAFVEDIEAASVIEV